VGWAFLYMFLFLKIPILMALWLIWWAVRDQPAPEEDRTDGGSGPRRHRHPRPRLPGPTRRGPHAEPPPAAPKRVRATGRRLTPSRH
jgi:hypothetical protein